jgi:hypothetical protein
MVPQPVVRSRFISTGSYHYGLGTNNFSLCSLW